MLGQKNDIRLHILNYNCGGAPTNQTIEVFIEDKAKEWSNRDLTLLAAFGTFVGHPGVKQVRPCDPLINSNILWPTYYLQYVSYWINISFLVSSYNQVLTVIIVLYVQWIFSNRFQGLRNVSILLFIAGCGKWMWLDLWDTTPGPLCRVWWTYYQTRVHPQGWYICFPWEEQKAWICADMQTSISKVKNCLCIGPILKHLCPEYEMDLLLRLKS